MLYLKRLCENQYCMTSDLKLPDFGPDDKPGNPTLKVYTYIYIVYISKQEFCKSKVVKGAIKV